MQICISFLSQAEEEKSRKYKYDGKVRGRIDEGEGNKVVEKGEREPRNEKGRVLSAGKRRGKGV